MSIQQFQQSKITLDAAIGYFVNITSNTDRMHLSKAVLASFAEIANSAHVALFEVVQHDGHFIPRMELQLSDKNSGSLLETIYTAKTCPQPLVNHFDQILGDAETPLHARLVDGRVENWMPISLADHTIMVVRTVTTHALDPARMKLLHTCLLVYRNFLDLIDYSERDSLTGLLNRKTFDKYLNEVQTSLPVQTRFSEDLRNKSEESGKAALAILDIDHFKKVNDTYGHLFGDEVLIMIANRMKQEFRSSDRLFRFGGEEFVVVLKNIDLVAAHFVLDRFRASIERDPFSHIGKISVSIGFTELNNERPAAALLGHADEALYFGKENGRNQVNCYENLIAAHRLSSVVDSGEIELF